MKRRSRGFTRRQFTKLGICAGSTLAVGALFEQRVFGGTTFLDEHFSPYSIGQLITNNPSGGGTTNWELWFDESDFVGGVHPCSSGLGGTCHSAAPVVSSFEDFARSARMDPSCSTSHLCNGQTTAIQCSQRDHRDYSNSCDLFTCTPAGKTIDGIHPTDRFSYQAYIDVKFDSIGSLQYKDTDEAGREWDHLGVFILVKRRPYTGQPSGTYLDSARFGCCIRPNNNLADGNQCFLQLTNPVNPEDPSEHKFAPPGGNFANSVMYTLGVSIQPYAFGWNYLVRAAVQNHSTGAITDKVVLVDGLKIDWITNPSVGFGYVSNCGARIEVDKVIAQNLP
ncbi:MAG: hypothetical protein ACR2L2_09540 [Acidobacteriota bacterium]